MTSALDSNDFALPVTAIRVTMHTTRYFFESDKRSGNHSSIFLLTGDGMSVRLNMIKAGPTDTMGTFTLTRCRYINSSSSLHNIDLPAARGLTVQRVIELIYARGREKYRLAPNGLGCRFWVKTIIDDLDSAGYVDSSGPVSVARVHNDLQYNYTRNKEPEFDAIVPGTFI